MWKGAKKFNFVLLIDLFLGGESDVKFNVKAYQLLLDMKSMCEMKKPGVSFKQDFELHPFFKNFILDELGHKYCVYKSWVVLTYEPN
jgi:hypothetical protein